MSAVSTPNAGKSSKRSSVLGAGRKVVAATVRRPLRRVGRFVGRGRSSSSGSGNQDIEDVVDEGDSIVDVDEGEEVILEEDEGSSTHSTEIVVQAQPNISSKDRDGFRSSTRGLRSLGTEVTTHRHRILARHNDPDWPVHAMERFLRQVLLVFVAYMIGASRPTYLSQVARITEYVLTAWGTCAGILFLAFMQRQYPNLSLQSYSSSAETATGVSPALLSREVEVTMEEPVVVTERTPLLEHDEDKPMQDQQTDPISIAAAAAVAASDDPGDVEVMSLEDDPNELPHPSLTPFYVMDVFSGQRIIPNASEPILIETDWFYCNMVLIIRTPDVDDPNLYAGSPSNKKTSDYLRHKQRRFEFQYQIKLKKKPIGKAIYFACHLDEPIKMGVIQRAFVGAAMAFVKTTNPTFHYSIQGSKYSADGKWEKPCMSFTAEGSLDRLIVTRKGETPPQLGTNLYEDPDHIKRRKKGGAIDWNTDDTYTMALWSAYVDFLDWRVINLPGIRPFSLSSVLGQQCINLTLYVIDENRCTDKHYQRDIETIIHFELSNERAATLGPSAKHWTKEQFVPKQKQTKHFDSTTQAPSPNSSDALHKQPSGLADSPPQRDLQRAKSTDMFGGDENEDVAEDVATAAELGEGIYLRSGDKVVLREFVLDGSTEDNNKNSVSNGGGFVVMQTQDAVVVIEKARHAKRNRLIKTGDAVLFKMIQKKGEETETRYLSIHRGWWLKWVSSAPTKNGYFTIHAHDSEVSQPDNAKAVRSVETQSTFLTLGGCFTLRHKRWSNYHVGVAGEPSPTYGGRLLGLYIPSSHKGKAAEEHQYHSDDDATGINDDGPEMTDDNNSKGDAPWMKPLVLSAHEPGGSNSSGAPSTAALDSNPPQTDVGGDNASFPEKLQFSNEHCQLEVPAWIEMMNRTERTPHLYYVVRVSLKSAGSADESETFDANGTAACEAALARLRTGRELAQIMRVGQTSAALSGKSPSSQLSSSSLTKPTMRGRRASSTDGTPVQSSKKSNIMRSSFHGPSTDGTATPPRRDGTLSLSPRIPNVRMASVPLDYAIDDSGSDEESVVESVDDGEEYGGVEGDCYTENEAEGVSSPDEREPGREAHEPSKRAVKKGRAILGKVAKTAKTATVVTGKTAVKTVVGTGKLTAKAAIGTGKLTAKAAVGTGKLTGKVAVGTGKTAVRASKKVALGTVNAGKAITMTAGKAVPVTFKSKHPPKQEPRRKNKERGLHSKLTKTMKRMERLESKTSRIPTVLAGELCAPEQSCRTASRVLSRMSSLPTRSPVWAKANNVLSSQLSSANEQDKLFLTGNSVQMGVTPLTGDQSRGILHHESVVARCLWESHWREEWCGMYETCVSLYAPMTKSPSLEIAYVDIQNVRPLDAGHLAPLPGFPLLVLETPWLCHYVAFRDEEARDTFGEKVEDAIAKHVKQVEESANIQESDLRKARFWQGLQGLSESSLSSGRGKWAPISSSQKLTQRTILNGRRMMFDLHTDMNDGYEFVEEVTSSALSFSLDSLENDPDCFVDFLDAISHLRLLPLEEVDSAGKDAFCLFVNLYHCLLQHAMLVSPNGPMEKRSAAHFMRTACYEIGGDVFSLAELHGCVIRGKMSRPINPKPPYIEPPKKSSAHRFYALEYTDARVNFVLNTGDIACPSTVPVLRATEVEHQLNSAAAIFLKHQLFIDTNKHLVVLPKVCEVYKNDFGADSLSCLRFCMGGLDESTASTIRVMMMDESSLAIRYQHTSEHYHTCLTLREGQGIQMAALMNALYQSTDKED